jgi:8-oxo-dGTP diphosphatase
MTKYVYDYPRPGLTSDIVLFRLNDKILELLLIERGDYPFIGSWALPGGFVDDGESAEIAAKRELLEETGINNTELKEVCTTTTPGRDPRGWTVSIIFMGFVTTKIQAIAGDDARLVRWFPVTSLPEMAFDHHEMVIKTIEKLKEIALFRIFGFEVLSTNFSLEELTDIYRQINLSEEQIESLIEKLINSKAILLMDDKYRFSLENVSNIMEEGFL